MKALVTGGYFDDSGEAVVWLADFASEEARVLTRWTPPPHLRVAGRGFTGGSLDDDGTLYVGCHAALARIDTDSGEVTGVLHQPCMNDLHHVLVDAGRLYVANTGLGSIDVFDVDGRFLGSHAALPAWVNRRRMRGEDPTDFDQVTKVGWDGIAGSFQPRPTVDDGYHEPDRAGLAFHKCRVPDHLHLNHVCRSGRRLLATSFSTGRLFDVHDLETVWHQPDAYLHDGLLRNGQHWLTSIDGKVFAVDAETFVTTSTISVFDTTGRTGWCRGLAVLDQSLLVGLTEVRPERLPGHRWSEAKPETSETSVLMVDRQSGALLARVDLTDHARHAKIYSVLPFPAPVANPARPQEAP